MLKLTASANSANSWFLTIPNQWF